MAKKAEQDRRNRMRAVVLPLTTVPQFTSEQAKELCNEAAPTYVAATLKQLVASEFLRTVDVDGGEVYRWIDQQSFQPDAWIEGEIHGDQVKQSPVHERPREKLARLGAAKLSDGDLLAILIRSGIRGESAITGGERLAKWLARQNRLGSLPEMTCAEVREVTKAVNVANFAQIMAGIELGRRIAAIRDAVPTTPLTKITSTAEAIQYCRQRFARLAGDGVQEEFHIVTLDTKHKPIHDHQITVGTLDASLVHPREVFRPAIRDAAAAVLLIHNHPSGDPTPSREDIAVTDHLTDSGKLLGINVLDHIIVAKQRCLSIREEG